MATNNNYEILSDVILIYTIAQDVTSCISSYKRLAPCLRALIAGPHCPAALFVWMYFESETNPDHAALVSRLLRALSQPRSTAFVISAPPGAGKTTLSTRAAAETGRTVLSLEHNCLSSSASGDVELSVQALFARATAAAPAVLIIDNIDAVAPANPSGPADLRALAALEAAMDDLALDPAGCAGLVLLATASYLNDVHPALLRPGRFSDVVVLRPPDWARRRALLASAVQASDEAELHGHRNANQLDDLASMTPGFLPADLDSLVSAAQLEQRKFREERAALDVDNDPGSQMTLCTAMIHAVHSIRPTLLHSAGSSWTAIPWRAEATGHLRGLDRQVEELSLCVRGTFGHIGQPAGKQVSPGRQALDVLGGLAGVLLHGASGSGKSALAAAAPSFLRRGAVNAFLLDSAEIVGAVVGAAEQRLRALFTLARAAAPTIMVIENIEVLAPRRSELDAAANSSGASFKRLLSTFLVELDGLDDHGSGSGMPIFLVGTSRDVGNVDQALLRPGRLEKHVRLTFPDEPARAKLFMSFCGRTLPRLCMSESEAMPAWILELAKGTHGWSAADIRGFCDEVVLRHVRHKTPFPSEQVPSVCGQTYVSALSAINKRSS